MQSPFIWTSVPKLTLAVYREKGKKGHAHRLHLAAALGNVRGSLAEPARGLAAANALAAELLQTGINGLKT